MKRLLASCVAALTFLVLGACGQSDWREAEHGERPRSLSQRFFSGAAAEGKFLTLESLPPIPASFEEAEQ